jgi:inosine/xanthosine triphosphatase
MKIGVGSQNPVKVAAVQQAMKKILERQKQSLVPEITGYEVESLVSAQPRTESETRTGACNRAQNVLQLDSALDMAVGMEGGVCPDGDDLFSTVWVCVTDRSGRKTEVNGARFRLPKAVAEPIQNGEEMGKVMDRLTGKTNIKHQEGMIGTLTGGALTRQEEYENLVTLALGLFFRNF